MMLATHDNWKTLADVLAAFSTPVIAAAVGYVAYQQYRTDKIRLQHELYDRRFAVLTAARELIGEVLAQGKVTYETVFRYQVNVAQAEFLFGPDVFELLEEIRHKALDLAFAQEKLYPSDGSDGLSVGAERSEVASQKRELGKWFRNQPNQLRATFRPYLDVGWVKGDARKRVLKD